MWHEIALSIFNRKRQFSSERFSNRFFLSLVFVYLNRNSCFTMLPFTLSHFYWFVFLEKLKWQNFLLLHATHHSTHEHQTGQLKKEVLLCAAGCVHSIFAWKKCFSLSVSTMGLLLSYSSCSFRMKLWLLRQIEKNGRRTKTKEEMRVVRFCLLCGSIV